MACSSIIVFALNAFLAITTLINNVRIYTIPCTQRTNRQLNAQKNNIAQIDHLKEIDRLKALLAAAEASIKTLTAQLGQKEAGACLVDVVLYCVVPCCYVLTIVI